MHLDKIHVSLAAALVLLAAACSGDSPAASSGDDTDASDASINTDIFDPGDSEDDTDAIQDDAVSEDSGETEPGEDAAVSEDSTSEGLARFEECGFNGPRCESPLQCLGTCQLPCSAGCPEDEECIDLSGVGAAGICGVIVGEGEDCDFNTATFCDDGLFCNDDGQCEAPSVAGVGDPCGGQELECDDGLTCVSIGFGEGFCHTECEEQSDCDTDEVCISSFIGSGACYEDCTLPDDTECSDNINYECRTQIGSDEAACFPRQGGPIGEQTFGEACDNENRCAEDLLCPPLLPNVYCTQECDATNPCPTDPAGAECVNLYIAQYCLFTCDGDPTACPEGMTCNDVFGMSLCTY